jgi:hypothetical protein
MKGESDIRELMIMNPPNPQKQKELMMKRIFVRDSPDARTLNTDDLWNRIQRQGEMLRDGSKLVFRQVLKENTAQTQLTSQIKNALRALKEDQANLKREVARQKEITEGYRKELLVAAHKIEEKDRQLAQFRKMFESRAPPSPGSIHPRGMTTQGGRHPSDGGGIEPSRPRRVSDQHLPLQSSSYNSSGHAPNYHEQSGRHRGSPPRPSNSYLRDHRNNPYEEEPLGGDARNGPSYHTNSSRTPPHQYHNQHNQRSSHPTLQNPYQLPSQAPQSYPGGASVATRRSTGSGGIRHITASTGYSFEASSDPQQRRTTSKKRPLSPSHAYGSNPYHRRAHGPSEHRRQSHY